MLSLLELQTGFAATLLEGGGPPCMAVYRGNVFGNWGAALGGAFPVARRIVGAQFFDAMARDYARVHPSQSGDLHEYGARLAGFLKAYPHAQDLPYLPDVARMEWLVHRAHYAADPLPFDFSRPTEVRLAPSCALLESDWPLARIWQAHQEGGEPEAVDLDAGPDRVLIHRTGWRAEVCSLRPGDYRFLQRLQAGAELGAALEAAAIGDPGFLPQVALAAWVQAGVLTQ